MEMPERNSSSSVAAGHRNLETMAHVHREPNGSRAYSYPNTQTQLSVKRVNNCTVNSQNLQNGQLTRHTDNVIRDNNVEGELREYPRRPHGFYINYCPRCAFLDPSVELRRIQLERDYNRQNMKETLKEREEVETRKFSITQLSSAGKQNGAFVLDEPDHNFQLVPLNKHNRNKGLGKALVNASAFQTSNGISKNLETQTSDKRETSWVSEYDMYVATITYMIGLGNVLRFSKLCLDNGGGAFLIPYIIMLVFAGIPLVCLEMSVGQRAGYRSPLKCWKSLEPNLKWIGFASFMNLLICTFYYCLMVTWCFYYLCFSLTSSLPWNECTVPTEKVNNRSAINSECEPNSAAFFWFRSTLDISDDMSHSNDFNGKLYGFILVSWTIVWLLVMKGVRASSRALYILLLFIIVLLAMFFFVGVHLKGWAQGLAVFFIPKFEQLKDPQVWLDAAGQIVFSLGVGYGGISSFASLNQPQNDFFTDSVICALANAGTSIWASIIMFSFFGFKAHYQSQQCFSKMMNATPGTNQSECDMSVFLRKIQGGTSLAFVDMSEAFTELETTPSLWSALFYLLLFLLGSTSLLGMVQVVYATVKDIGIFPRHWRQEIMYGAICLAFSISNLVFSQPNGYYLLRVIDNSTTIPLLLVALFECLGVSYFYGMKRFNDDVKRLTGKDITTKWKICWQIISPVITLVLVIAGITKTALKGGFTYSAWDRKKATEVIRPYPPWAYILYTVCAVIPAIFVVIVPIKYFCASGTCQSRFTRIHRVCQDCMTSRSGSYSVRDVSDPSWTQDRSLNGHI